MPVAALHAYRQLMNMLLNWYILVYMYIVVFSTDPILPLKQHGGEYKNTCSHNTFIVLFQLHAFLSCVCVCLWVFIRANFVLSFLTVTM